VKSNYRVKPLDVVSIVMDRPRRELEIIPEDIFRHQQVVYLFIIHIVQKLVHSLKTSFLYHYPMVLDDLLMPEEDETSSSQMYEHFRFVADKGQSLLRVDKFIQRDIFGDNLQFPAWAIHHDRNHIQRFHPVITFRI